MANKTIPNLPDYGSQDTDKIKKDLLEITKNDGTYASPSYPIGASRKITVEEFKTALAIESLGFKTDDITYNAGWGDGTSLVMLPYVLYKVQMTTVGTNKLLVTFDPTAPDGSEFMITDGSVNGNINSLVWITGIGNISPRIVMNSNETLVFTKSDGVVWLTSRTNKNDSSALVSDSITDGVTTVAPSQNAVFDALALKEPVITKNSLSTPLVWTSANGVASFQPIPVLGDLTYYFTNTASDVATYYKQTTTPQVALTSLPFASVTDGQLLATFISEPNNPNRTSIPDGQYLNHLHLGKTGGTKDLQVRSEIWETTSAGVDIAKLADLGPSSILVGSGSTEYIIGYNTVEKTLSGVTSRIATKLYAVVGVSGSAPSVSIFQGDGSDSRSNLPAPVVDATNYVPYVGALNDVDLGSKKITAQDVTVSSATVSTPTFFDTAKKLITTTAQLWGTWVQTWGSKATPVDADTIGFYDSATTFVGVKSTLLNLWTAYLLPKITALNYGETSIEIWSTNANYTTINTTAKRLVVLQTGTFTAPRTITLNDVTGAGQEVVIVSGGSVTASNYIRVAVGFKINVTLNNVDISTTYSQTLFTSVSTNSWTGGSVGLLRQDATWGQLAGSGGTAGSNGNIFSILNSSASTILLGLKDDGTQVQMNSTKHSFGTLTPGQIIFDRNLTFSNLIIVTATNTTSTNYIQGWLNVGQSIYGFRYSNTLVALWQSNDNTASTILQKWSNASNVQIGVLQNDGLYFGTGTKSASAIGQFDSTTQGFLPPRMTNAQRTAIAGGTPPVGLSVYCTDAPEGLYTYKSTGWTFII